MNKLKFGEQRLSKNGLYEIVPSDKNGRARFKQLAVQKFMEDLREKKRVFKTQYELQRAIDLFNKYSEIKYDLRATESSVIVNCRSCDLY